MYFEKSVRCRFFRDSNFELHMCESITILMSLFRSKNVCSLADSFCVPVFEPLRFVEVIVILLADFLLKGFILLLLMGSQAHLSEIVFVQLLSLLG